MGSIPGSGRSPGGGDGNPLQYYCLENPLDRGAWWATVQSRKELDTTNVTEHTHKQHTYIAPYSQLGKVLEKEEKLG